MNEALDYVAAKSMDWQEVVKLENLCETIKEISDGWWLFQHNPRNGNYHGVLGWQYGGTKFFVKHNPAALVSHYVAVFGYDQEKQNHFCDGRQIKWIARSFLPPLARNYAKLAIQQIGALDPADVEELERIHAKIEQLLVSGSVQHNSAMKVAKRNREFLRKKWTGNKQGKSLPNQPEMPENVSKTLIFLNGNNE